MSGIARSSRLVKMTDRQLAALAERLFPAAATLQAQVAAIQGRRVRRASRASQVTGAPADASPELPVHASLLDVGPEDATLHRERAQLEGIAAHAVARGLAAPDLRARLWGQDAARAEDEAKRPHRPR